MIFIDRSVPRAIARGLQCVRGDVAWLEDRFPHNTPDVDWLREAGQQGWLVISRDKKIRTRPGERAMIAEARVGCFIINTRRDPPKWDYFKLIVTTLDEMERRFRETSRPFVFTISDTGAFNLVFPRA